MFSCTNMDTMVIGNFGRLMHHSEQTIYVTVYAKTVPIGTTIEIHFMA